LWITLLVLLLASPRWAVAAPAPIAVKGQGQAELRIHFEGATVVAVACTNANCPQDNAQRIAVPAEAAPHVANATLRSVQLGQRRQAAIAQVPLPGGEKSWQALIAAAVDGSATVKVVWSGMTGWLQGEMGERQGPMVSVRGNTVLIGDVREDIQLCGRPTILSARAVVPSDLSLRSAKVQQLASSDRAAAPKLVAKPDTGAAPTGSPLRAVAASSAVGSPQALTDGNPKTFWGEHRGSDGRGEFIMLRAAKELGLTGLALQVHPGNAAPATGAAPKELWLVTDDALFHVTLPDKSWQPTTPRLRIDFPAAVHTSCLAVVLEKGEQVEEDSQVIISELWGISALGQNWDEIAAQLDQGAQAAAAALEALSFGGEPAYAAVLEAMSGFGPAGQALGLQVLDQAPCAMAAPSYWAALQQAPVEPGAEGANHRRLQRCRREISELLLADLDASKGAARVQRIGQLAQAAPAVLVEKAPQWLPRATARERKALRDGLQVAADAPDAEGPLRVLLRDETLGPRVQLQVLRALASRAQRFAPEYAAAFRRQVRLAVDFEQRYLLLKPAGALARFDSVAASFLRSSMQQGAEWELRGEAAQRADAALFARELTAASRDPEVRVRLAAVESLGVAGNAAVPALLARLAEDAWPMVRMEAVRSLLASKDQRVNAALGEALDDDSRQVRRTVAFALGQRGARSHTPELRDLFQDEEEDPSVRAAAAVSLGQLCDAGSAPELTRLARTLGSLTLSESELLLGRASLQGLGLLKPADLQRRLAPLLDARAPAAVRRLARQAMQAPSQCQVTAPKNSAPKPAAPKPAAPKPAAAKPTTAETTTPKEKVRQP
jgi:hypothetical protein